MCLFHRSRNDCNNVCVVGSNNIEIVNTFKLLGVTVDNNLSFNSHVNSILSQCNQRFYLLKLLKQQGMNLSSLHCVYQSIIVNRITYGLSAWGGLIKQKDVERINKLFKKAKKYGYTNALFDFKGLLYHNDSVIFKKMLDTDHCLNPILPNKTPYGKRTRQHSYDLPKCTYQLYRNSFLPRVLYMFN